ncbi:MAG: hypothetical protein WBB22_00445, partial [Anaerolineae bacterium]
EVCLLAAFDYEPDEISAIRDGLLAYLDSYVHADVGDTLDAFAAALAVFASSPPPLPEGVLSATIDLDPDRLNAKSRGRWITAYIELPSGYSPEQIDCPSIFLADSVAVDSCDRPAGPTVGDYDDDGIPDLMVKFRRAAVLELVQGGPNGLAITGSLVDGTVFGGADSIRVLMTSK